MSPTTPPAAGGPDAQLAKNLGIKPGTSVVVLHRPAGFDELLGPLPEGTRMRRSLPSPGRCDLLIAFVRERRQLAARVTPLTGALAPDGVLWVAWPKQSSGVSSDLSDQVIRDLLLPTGWVDTKVCAIDSTWSGLKLVLRKALRPGSTVR